MEPYKEKEQEIIGKSYKFSGLENWYKDKSIIVIAKQYLELIKKRVIELDPALKNCKFFFKTDFEDVKPTYSKCNFHVSMWFESKVGEQYIIGFSMEESGNCCGSVMLYDMKLEVAKWQQNGLGKIMLQMAYDCAVVNTASNMLCINVEGRNFNNSLLKFGFRPIHKFHNNNSNNYCELFSTEVLPFEKNIVREIKVNKINDSKKKDQD